MISEWLVKRMYEIANINPRESLKKGTTAKKVPMDQLIPFCRDIPTYQEAIYEGGSKFRNGDTIMARITPCLENGKIAKVNILNENEIGFGSTEYIVFRAKDNVNEDYLYYLVCSSIVRDPAIQSMVGSSGRQRVQIDVLQNLEILVPSKKEQNKIGSILKAIDDKIDINTKINRNLSEQTLAIYHKMFVETDNASRTTCRIDEYFDITIGKTPPRKEKKWFSKNPIDCVWISISDMGSCGTFITDSSEYLTRAAVDKHNVKVVPDNTVILSFKLTVGRVAITVGETTTNEAIAHFNTSKDNITEYLYCYLKSFDFDSLGSTSSIGTAVNSKTIKAMEFVNPEEKELQEFCDIVRPMFEQIKKNQFENQYLEMLRDSLLPKLMSGELDVSDLKL